MLLCTGFSCPIVRRRISVFLLYKFKSLINVSVQNVAELPGSIKAYVFTTLSHFFDLIFTGTMARMHSLFPSPVYPHVSWPTETVLVLASF